MIYFVVGALCGGTVGFMIAALFNLIDNDDYEEIKGDADGRRGKTDTNSIG